MRSRLTGGSCPAEVRWRLPEWVPAFIGQHAGMGMTVVEDRMRFVLGLAEQNVNRGTGGPCAAAVFSGAGFVVVSVGVNIVLAARSSIAHAEMVALTLAQQRLGSHDLGLTGRGDCELVTSVGPCAMCLGAVPWAGVRRLVCGARDADARAIGFDEGQKPRRWVAGLRARGIDVVRDVLRGESAALLEAYRRGGGAIYNSAASCGRR